MNRSMLPTRSSAWAVAALLLGLVACTSPDPEDSSAGVPGSTDESAGSEAPRAGAPPRAPSTPTPSEGGDKTVEVRFAPGTSSATFTDTLRTFALHDYLVRARAGQTLTATLRSEGSGGPTVIVIPESTYRGPEGDFETLAPEEQGGTAAGYVWAGPLPVDGTYRVRVAHSGSSANGGTVSPYVLIVGVE